MGLRANPPPRGVEGILGVQMVRDAVKIPEQTGRIMFRIPSSLGIQQDLPRRAAGCSRGRGNGTVTDKHWKADG